MITLTDEEQKTALRSARYVFAAIERAIVAGQDNAENQANMERLKRVIGVLETKNDNGMWRCLCPNPWRHPTCLVCSVCGAAVPT